MCEGHWAQCLNYGRLPVMVTVIVLGIATLVAWSLLCSTWGFHQPPDFADYLVTRALHPQICLLSLSHKAIGDKIRKVGPGVFDSVSGVFALVGC